MTIDLQDAIEIVQFELFDLGVGDARAPNGELLREWVNGMMRRICDQLREAAQ